MLIADHTRNGDGLPSPPTDADAAAAVRMAELVASFFGASASRADLSERMAFADTVVHIHFIDGGTEDVGCTVWLDRAPITAEPKISGTAEIELFAPSDVFKRLIAGTTMLPLEIAHGHVTYTGPVRKFLRVVPILRAFDFEVFRGETQPVSGAAPAG